MDRKRLSEVQQKDLTESRLNEDFLFWLRGSGSNYALVILLGACAFLGWEWYKKDQSKSRDAAWEELATATTPPAFRDVANKNSKFGGLAMMALLQVGEGDLMSVLRGVRFDREPGAADAALTRDLREQYLADADSAYAEVASRAGAMAGGAGAPLLIPALLGRASVAECRGDFAAAKQFLEQAQVAATPNFPVALARAATRLETLDGLASPYPIPEGVVLPSILDSVTPTAAPTAAPPVTPTDTPAVAPTVEPAIANPAPASP